MGIRLAKYRIAFLVAFGKLAHLLLQRAPSDEDQIEQLFLLLSILIPSELISSSLTTFDLEKSRNAAINEIKEYMTIFDAES